MEFFGYVYNFFLFSYIHIILNTVSKFYYLNLSLIKVMVE